MKTPWSMWAQVGAGLLLGALVMFGVQRCRPQDLSPELRTRVDSVQATRQAHRDTVAREEKAAKALDTRADSVARRARTSTPGPRNPIGQPSGQSASDSARYWQLAYRGEVARSDSLARANRKWAEADSLRRVARDTIWDAFNRVKARNAVLEPLVDELAALRGCTVNLLVTRVRCPTRKEALVVGIVTGAVGVWKGRQIATGVKNVLKL